jgi:hypothetical protein
VLGWTLEVLGLVGSILFAFLALCTDVIDPLFILGHRIPNDISIFSGVSLFIVLPVGAYAAYFGKRMMTMSSEELLKQDTRPPVLYLRSFEDDELAAKQVKIRLLAMARSDVVFSGTTEEETLAKVFNRIGPCIALGRPGEKLPPLGMSRLYFADSDWKNAVEMLIKQASLVILRAGSTEGFFWEFGEVIKAVDPRKLLLLLPFNTINITEVNQAEWMTYTRFIIEANKLLPRELPPFHVGRMMGTNLTGAIWFEADWTPHAVRLIDMGGTLTQSLNAISKRYSGSKESTAA